VPGGGAALLRSVRVLDTLAVDGEEHVGVKILAHALGEPMRAILHNAGFDANPVVHRAQGCGEVFDVVRREWGDPWRAGLGDPLQTMRTALEVSVSCASVALTTDVLVHRNDASVSVEP